MTTPRTQFSMTRDANGYPAYGLAFSDLNYITTLTASAEQTQIIPSTYENWVAVFQYSIGNNVLVANGTVAITAPSGSFSTTPAQLNPTVRQVKGGSTLRFYTTDSGGATVAVSLYYLPGYQ